MRASRAYGAGDLLRLAKRQGNEKRPYLLVNPLQGKHLPVSPGAALAMMAALGERARERCGEARLAIGFAETATAIGAMVAASLGDGCTYLPTTRERLPEGVPVLDFREEHSHAPEQWVSLAGLEGRLADSPAVVFVDDEFSTGRTLRRMVRQLRERFPLLSRMPLAAASVLNRLSPEQEALWREEGIEAVPLLRLPQEDYAGRVAPILTRAAAPPPEPAVPVEAAWISLPFGTCDPRLGVPARAYLAACEAIGDALAGELSARGLREDASLLVLGTEECMLPALAAGRKLEGQGFHVLCHATTRSPIGISEAPGYPVRRGWRIPSLYDGARATYIYNLAPYDLALAVTDAPGREMVSGLLAALAAGGCRRVLLAQIAYPGPGMRGGGK